MSKSRKHRHKKEKRHKRNMKIWFLYKIKKQTRDEIYKKLRINYSLVNYVISNFNQGRYPLKERIKKVSARKISSGHKPYRFTLSEIEKRKRHNARHLVRYSVKTGKIRKYICLFKEYSIYLHKKLEMSDDFGETPEYM